MICMGVAAFMYKDKKPSESEADHSFGFGEVLLVSKLDLAEYDTWHTQG